MKKCIWTLALALLVLALPVAAKTPDGLPPSVETVCDGQTGAAFGLCNAYCEAMDCDSPAPHASATACAKVGSHFQRITGSPVPCDSSCPCSAQIALFFAFTNGDQTISQCISNPNETTFFTPGGDYAIVTSSGCQATNQDLFVELTPAESALCVQALLSAAAAQPITCSAGGE